MFTRKLPMAHDFLSSRGAKLYPIQRDSGGNQFFRFRDLMDRIRFECDFELLLKALLNRHLRKGAETRQLVKWNISSTRRSIMSVRLSHDYCASPILREER
jgi:hypothetical protein